MVFWKEYNRSTYKLYRDDQDVVHLQQLGCLRMQQYHHWKEQWYLLMWMQHKHKVAPNFSSRGMVEVWNEILWLRIFHVNIQLGFVGRGTLYLGAETCFVSTYKEGKSGHCNAKKKMMDWIDVLSSYHTVQKWLYVCDSDDPLVFRYDV